MGTTAQIRQENDGLRFDVLPKSATAAFKICAKMDFLSDGKWYLAGGTALALQMGHRKSIDLDFFTRQKTFDEKKLEKILNNHGKWVTTSLSGGTLYGELVNAKISFISYPFFKPAKPMMRHGTILLLTPQDIAVMKIIAISQRGKKRDFFDLYWICKNVQPLYDNILKVHKQYSIRQNLTHILKSLVYFEDAESDPEPEIFFKASWREVKEFFKKEIPIITKKLIGLK